MTRTPPSFSQRIAGLVPFGLGQVKPHHFLSMARVAWQNRGDLRYAWKVLTRGVCDGCALGTSGLRDWTIDDVHLCMVRLELLHLNTMGPLDVERLADVSSLEGMESKALRALGRLPVPLRRRRGEPGFTRVHWDEVWRDVGPRWSAAPPERTAMYLTSRGITNEVYYVAQKVMRYLGSNNVDNSARLCHAPSTSGLKTTLGVAATTCSYTDWFDADLIVFFGSNPANDQPVAMKYLVEARRRGTRVVVVNAYREPGMARYWVPSNTESALFGTRMADDFVLVRVGGDLAFLCAVQKLLIERGQVAMEFVESSTTGFDELAAMLEGLSLDELSARCGVPRAAIERFADEVARADRGIFVWSMGITQHAHGADTVRGIVNLGLLREFVGRPGTGMMPIRGHSGVQGGAEMGAYATVFPGGRPVDAEGAARISELWDFEVPDAPGLTTVGMLEAARRGAIDALWCVGGNFLETMPEPRATREALASIPLRVHADIVLTSQMLVEPADTVYLLPSRTRYEQRGGGTETTTERRVIFSPYIPGHDVGEAASEWEMLLELARSARPFDYHKVHFPDGQAIRDDIARAIPAYRGIEALRARGDAFQWGGPRLCEGRRFPTADGRARFSPVGPPERAVPDEDATVGSARLLLATRRGKQFNSMVQAEVDPLTGAARDHVLVAREDARRLGLAQDARVRLTSAYGSFEGRAFVTDVAPGTVQGHWPEVNVLIGAGPTDPEGGIPDYNAVVTLEPLR